MAKYYVSTKNPQKGDGTKENPFQQIGQAAKIALPGDYIEVGGGIYRECVSPACGGSSEQERITYQNAPNEVPIITGAEPVTGWVQAEDGIWCVTVANECFGAYNPFATPIYGDWYYDLSVLHHTGEVYLDGKGMYEVPSYQALFEPFSWGAHEYKWLEKTNHKDFVPLQQYKWFAKVTQESTTLFANFQAINPNEVCTEISVRQSCFFPEKEHLDYITVSGFTMKQAATQWAPPTAFQTGVIGPNWSKGWIIENCIISDAKCSGISLGKRANPKDNAWSKQPIKKGAQTQTEMVFLNLATDWDKETIGHHLVRNNTIFNCGQAGIVGHMGCAFSVIEHNHIYNINVRDEFSGLEIAGIKFHCGIDVRIRNNCIHDCYRGLWLDWEGQGARATGNSFFANKDNDLYIEVCHGPCLIDNNLFLSGTNFLNTSQGTALVHNLFAGEVLLRKEMNRYTMYHLPHSTKIKGVICVFGGDDKIRNNIYIGAQGKDCGTSNYNEYLSKNDPWDITVQNLNKDFAMPVDIEGNLYLNGATPYQSEVDAVVQEGAIQWQVVQEGAHFYLHTNLYQTHADFSAQQVTTANLGKAFQSDAYYEDASGAPLVIDHDFAGQGRVDASGMKGPFAQGVSQIQLI